MKMTTEQVNAAKNRRLKEPLEITGYAVEVSKIARIDQKGPETIQTFVTRKINTIGDFATLDAHTKLGKFVPMPDLSLQALLIVIDKLGLLEEKEDDDG